MGIEQKVIEVKSEYIIGDVRIGGLKEYAISFLLAAAAASAIAGGIYLQHRYFGQKEENVSAYPEIKDTPWLEQDR